MIWRVDDLEIPHKNPKVVLLLIDELSKVYGGIMSLLINRGRTHNYLGMIMDYSTKGKVHTTMYQCINTVLKGLQMYTRVE